MWKKWFAFSGMLLLIVLLDPTHTPAQPGGKRDWGKRGDGSSAFPTSGTFPGSGGSTFPGGSTPGGSGFTPGGGSGFPGGFRGPGGFPGGGDRGPGGFTPGGGSGFPSRGDYGRGPGGGSFGGGGPSRGMDPERTWSMLTRFTGSTGDTIDVSKVPQQTRDWLNRSGAALPESGTLTKAAFLQQAAARAGGTSATPAAPVVVTFGADGSTSPAMTTTPGAWGQPGGFGGGSFGGGFGGPGGDPTEFAMRRIREQDRNGDGKISPDEASGRMRDRWRDYDRNGDGSVDLDEYKLVIASMTGGGGPGRGPGGDSNSQWGGGFGSGGFERQPTQEERPVAMRYGKLPKDLPPWFEENDTDKDGQVGLWEWRKASKDVKDFGEMDLNSDGLITADEYLRFARQKNIDTKVEAYEKGERGPGNWNLSGPTPVDKGSFDGPGGEKGKGGWGEKGKGGWGGWGDKGGDKGEKKGEKRNPWGKKN